MLDLGEYGRKSAKFRFINILLIIAFIITFTACSGSGQSQQPQQMSAQQQQQFEKEPQKLKAIEAKIEEIFKALDGPSINISEQKQGQGGGGKSSQGSSSQSKSTGQSSQQSKSSQQGQSSQQSQSKQGTQGGQSGQQSQQKPPQPQPVDKWKVIGQTVSNLHYQWNDYMPDAVKKGAGVKIIDNFSSALNALTVTIQSKDQGRTLKAANALYQYVPDLYSLYRTKMSPEIKRMVYYVRNIVLDSSSDDWKQADSDTATLDSSWSIAKNSLGKEQQSDMSKLDFSISELKKVVKAKDKQLTDIKGRVAMTNIEAIEKSYEKESSGSQGKSGGS